MHVRFSFADPVLFGHTHLPVGFAVHLVGLNVGAVSWVPSWMSVQCMQQACYEALGVCTQRVHFPWEFVPECLLLWLQPTLPGGGNLGSKPRSWRTWTWRRAITPKHPWRPVVILRLRSAKEAPTRPLPNSLRRHICKLKITHANLGERGILISQKKPFATAG